MEPLIIKATEDTPEIVLDPENGIFKISDRSLPENAIEFYQPVFEWLKNYSKEPDTPTNFEFKLEYFTTSSAKQIIKILLILQEISTKSEVNIKWYYKKEDVDMYASGLKYQKLINANFELVEY